MEPYLKDKQRYKKMQGGQNVISELIKQTQIYTRYIQTNGHFQQNGMIDQTLDLVAVNGHFNTIQGCKVAVFHGKPDPNQLANPHPHESYDPKTIEWVKNHWK